MKVGQQVQIVRSIKMQDRDISEAVQMSRQRVVAALMCLGEP